MSRKIFLAAGVLLALSAFGQQSPQIQESSLVVNVEVPVRVFQGAKFVDNLTIEDFELLEDGVHQKIEAAYLVNKRAVTRREEERKFTPRTSRNFYLFFEISEYMPKIDEALDYFLREVVVPGDNIVVVTPIKTYHMRSEAIQAKSKPEILRQFREILRRDALAGTSEYRDTIQEMEKLAKSMSQSIVSQVVVGDSLLQIDEYGSGEASGRPLDQQLQIYADLLSSLENIRTVDQSKLMEFSELLKNKEGQKYVYLFYQKEFIPRIDSRILTQYMDLFQDRPDIQQTIAQLFDFYRRQVTFNVDEIRRAFADSSISCHFLFISMPPKDLIGVQMEESSDDIFGAFHQIAASAGGFIDSSANPASLMKNAVEASENYYLLYYTPLSTVRDGRFKEIKVRVKDKNVRVVHRVGYFAR
jgi:hypothetical protein